MRLRSIWIYLVVALVLAVLYFVEIQSKKARVAKKISTTTMFKVAPSDISSFSIDKGGVKIIVTKTGDGNSRHWVIESPVHAPADQLRVQRFLEKLSNLRWIRKISEEPRSKHMFGLEHPSLTISLTTSLGSKTLRIGALTPLGDDVYAQRHDHPSVYTISFADKMDLDVDLFDLRDKRLIRICPNRASKLVIKRKGKEQWALVRKENRWFFSNGGTEADEDRVRQILSRLWTMRATSIVEEAAEDLSRYGLKEPKMRIRVSKGKISQELWIGDRSSRGDGLYAKMADSSMVVTIRNWILSDIPPRAEDFRK